MRLSIKFGDGDPSDDLEALRDSHAAQASELEAVLRRLGVDESLPQRSDAVATLHRAARISGFPTVAYRISSAFAHFEPLVLFNSLDYEWQTADGDTRSTMTVTGLLAPLVIVTSVLRHASEVSASLFESTLGAGPFDEMEDQLRRAFLDHGQEQGADLHMR